MNGGNYEELPIVRSQIVRLPANPLRNWGNQIAVDRAPGVLKFAATERVATYEST